MKGLKHHESLHPGLLERGARSAWQGYRGWRARREAEQDGTHFQVETETLDGIERVKLWFARTAMFLGAFLLLVVAAWSVGSMHGHSFLFLLRGGAFHFAEIL